MKFAYVSSLGVHAAPIHKGTPDAQASPAGMRGEMSDVCFPSDDLCSSWTLKRPATAPDEFAVAALRDVEGAGREKRWIRLCHERQGSIEQNPFIMRLQKSGVARRQKAAHRACVRRIGDPNDVGHCRDHCAKRRYAARSATTASSTGKPSELTRSRFSRVNSTRPSPISSLIRDCDRRLPVSRK